MSAGSEQDRLLQGTCQAIVDVVGQTLNSEPADGVVELRLPNGAIAGKQMNINASEKDGGANLCRLSVLDSVVAPQAELVRIEYEHEKKTDRGKRQVYSIQSVRRAGRELELMENFLAESPQSIREEDFRPITSEQYAQQTVLASLEEWTHFRAWQLNELKRK